MNELTLPRNHSLRVASVTAGLSVAGAIAGAGLGVAMTLLSGGLIGPTSIFQMLASAAVSGAMHGAVVLPAAAWLLLRRVPLGRALVTSSVATTLGAAVGLALSGLNPSGGVLGGAMGLALSTWWLRRSAATRVQTLSRNA